MAPVQILNGITDYFLVENFQNSVHFGLKTNFKFLKIIKFKFLDQKITRILLEVFLLILNLRLQR